ncbi:MAG: sigma-70 family RNA polymerase sigma factor [Cyanobacteria bacterium P01_G01_bin.54]
MDDATLNRELKQLALDAQGQPAGSRERRRSLDRLLRLLQASGKLMRPSRGYVPQLYEEIYAEACQRLFSHICQKIEQYRPDHEVMQWVNFLLKRRFFPEACQEFLAHYRPEHENPSRQPWLELSELEAYPHLVLKPLPSLGKQLRDYIETDPERCLTQCHIQDHPHVTFQVLALRVLAGYKWRELEAEFGITVPTLNGFYRKHLKRFTPRIKAYLEA